MTSGTATQTERVRRLLAHEGAVRGSVAACAEAACRVYDKSHAHLAPLLGSAGVRALLIRSVKLTQGEFPFLDVALVDSATKLRDCLNAQEATVAAESAEALFATFFALITTFIGERLTTQTLRRAWPTIEDLAPSATTPTRETDQ